MILAGDVGATKTILGLFTPDNGRPRLVSQQTFPTAAYSGLSAIVREFVPSRSSVERACFGVAGPVVNGVGEITNLSWPLEARTLASDLQIETVALINDMVATAYGVAGLKDEDLLVINEGEPVPHANAAVISAGTGLGECILHWDGRGYVPIPAEAGHADFAPHNDTTLELTRYLRQKTSTASVEQVLSGQGLVNIYNFLRSRGELPELPAIAKRLTQEDPPAVIAQAGLDNECPLCSVALNTFVSAYGAEAGNLALRSLALGGIYIGGGIGRKIRSRMQGELFMKAFINKDRQTALMKRIPVRIIMNENAPVFGAVNYLLRREA
jgi:glucokinase